LFFRFLGKTENNKASRPTSKENNLVKDFEI
jgi:hypothetical protein